MLSCCFSWVWLACPKFSETTNHQYLWKRLSDFVEAANATYAILGWRCLA